MASPDHPACERCGAPLSDITSMADTAQRFACCDCSAPVTAYGFGPVLLKALGLEGQRVVGLTLDMEAGGVVQLTLRRLLPGYEADALAQAVAEQHFQLVPAATDARSASAEPSAPRTNPGLSD